MLFVFQINIGQEKSKIEIKKSPFFDKDKEKFPDASILTRDNNEQVLISHDGIIMTCNQAYFYEEKNFIEVDVKYNYFVGFKNANTGFSLYSVTFVRNFL